MTRLGRVHRIEDAVNVGLLVLMTALPLADVILRPLSTNLPGAFRWVSILTLWIAFTGAMLASRDGKHLSLAAGPDVLPPSAQWWTNRIVSVVAALVTAFLTVGAVKVVQVEAEFATEVPPGIPGWVPLVIMPIGYGLVALRLVLQRNEDWASRLGIFVAVGAAMAALAYLPDDVVEVMTWPGLLVLLAVTVLGSPIYVALGGAALLLFWVQFEPIAAVSTETMRMMKSDTVPTIPLFTFTGYVLAESKASERLVRAFRAMFGWMPGGMAVMTTLVCAFFTTFTGASGVTILALGGLLYPVLRAERYSEDFSVGLLTASGSIGLLFPPSLPIILYGVVAKVPIDRMFVAGILPGLVLVAAVSALGVRTAVTSRIPRQPFDFAEFRAGVWEAKWELALPVILLGALFSGWAILIEAAALVAAYALFVEVVVHKDLRISDLPRVGRECATLVGGVLIILGVALGFTNYLVDAEIPSLALEWVKQGIDSKWAFLIALNVFLLLVGTLMDIYSAIVVVVPLILPIGEHFGVDPIHLGIIFLANLELGFLTPPVGMNLFLASFRFERPLTQVYRLAVPFLLILLVAVLIVTYVPVLTLGPVEWVFGAEPEIPEFKF